MTAAELLLLVVACYGLYRLLSPVQRGLERCLLRWLGCTSPIDAEIVKRKHKE